MLRLVARCGGQVRLWNLDPEESVVVGASPEGTDWTLPFQGVSRRHLRIECAEGGGVLLTDLGSKNGIGVDGRRVEMHRLSPGESVAVGRAVLSLEEVSSSDATLALDVETGLGASGRRTVPGETAPLSALRLVRQMDHLARSPAQTERAAILSRVAESMGAVSLWTLVEVEEDLFLRDCVGPVPSAGELRLLSERSRRSRTSETGGSVEEVVVEGLRFLLCPAPPPGLLVVAAFPAEPETSSWVVDLVDHLGEMLRRAEGASARGTDVSPDEREGLQLPEGMVVGRSEAMRGLLAHLEAAARSDLPVLLMGETGTGKELVARTLHASGPVREGRFVAINCAAIPSEMLEAELFGVAERVTTGVDPRPGLFLQASGGTLFLDEIGEMPDRLQDKLLRVLQEREVQPVGGDRPRAVGARIVAASNVDLRERARSGAFRHDLYYRIAGMELHVPPLSERVEDIPQLVLHCVHRCAEKYGRRIEGVSRKALSLLMAYEWPGNIRELENAVERAVLLCPDGGALESRHFDPVQWAVEHRQEGEAPFERYRSSGSDREHASALPPTELEDFRPLQERLDAVEIQAIREALSWTRGETDRAAELLDIEPGELRTRMKRLGLE